MSLLHASQVHPDCVLPPAPQIDEVVGDRKPGLDEIGALRFTMRVIAEAMRLYPQPPVLIRRALSDDSLGGFSVAAGSDIFISVWNIHRRAFPAQDTHLRCRVAYRQLVIVHNACVHTSTRGLLYPYM